ncbi:MAG: protease inhibitor I42 family protein [Aristaeellaceae bacterium]
MKKWIALLSAFLLTLSCAMAESSDAGHTAMLSLDANPSTGYSWVGFVLGGDSVQLDSAEGTYIPDEQTDLLTGAGGQTQYVITAVKPGNSIITLDYRRSWEDETLEQRVYLAVVDQELNLSMEDVTETGVLQGTVLSIDEAEHTAWMKHDTLGEILARFSPEMDLPALDEQIVIYTDGTMTLSLPATTNVLAWSPIPPVGDGEDADAAVSYDTDHGLFLLPDGVLCSFIKT